MVTWPIGLSTGCFHRQSLVDCLEKIRESGFSMVEVCSAPAHLDYHDLKTVQRAAACISDLGMEAYSFHAPFANDIDISSLDAARREHAQNEILRAAEAAAILQVHYFVIHPGPEFAMHPPAEERFQRMENLVGVLNRVAEHCRKLGIRCVLENKLPHLLFGRTSDILWILDALDGVEIGACLDTGHASLSGDLVNLILKLRGHLKMVHAHDNSGRGDDHLAPGDGRIDWPEVMRLLQAGGFCGAIMLELAGTPTPETAMANARRGRSFLRRICRRQILGDGR